MQNTCTDFVPEAQNFQSEQTVKNRIFDLSHVHHMFLKYIPRMQTKLVYKNRVNPTFTCGKCKF